MRNLRRQPARPSRPEPRRRSEEGSGSTGPWANSRSRAGPGNLVATENGGPATAARRVVCVGPCEQVSQGRGVGRGLGWVASVRGRLVQVELCAELAAGCVDHAGKAAAIARFVKVERLPILCSPERPENTPARGAFVAHEVRLARAVPRALIEDQAKVSKTRPAHGPSARQPSAESVATHIRAVGKIEMIYGRQFERALSLRTRARMPKGGSARFRGRPRRAAARAPARRARRAPPPDRLRRRPLHGCPP